MGKTSGLILIAIASALLIYFFIAPSLTPPSNRQAPPASAPASVPTQSPGMTGTAQNNGPATDLSAQPPLAPPRTTEQQALDALEAKRKPYYDWLRRAAADTVADVAVAADDRATLVLYARQDTPDMAAILARDAVFPYAFQYGFRRARFFLPNPPGAVEHYRFDAEATCGDDNHWNLFKK